MGLVIGFAVFGIGLVVLPNQYGVTSGFLAGLCAFLLVGAVIVFIAIPGPGTLHVLLRTVPVAGAVLVVAVLLLLSTDDDLRALWIAAAVAAAAWTAFAVWETRRSGG
jgi:hypothetical protein